MSIMKSVKLIEHNSLDPYFNLAAEEYFFRKSDWDYLLLWRNHNTIVIGKNQNPYNEVNLDIVGKNNVTIARRITGGGAVYHDLGNVNFTFIRTGLSESFDFRRFNEPVVKALDRFGVDARVHGRNDISVCDKKVSGSAQFLSENRVLHHGTLLYNSDLDFIGKCLAVSGEKLKSKGVASVRSRVANISDYMKNPVSVEEFIRVLKEFFFSEFEGCVEAEFSDEDLAGIRDLRESKFATWDWIYGSSPEYTIAFERRFEGCGNVAIYLDIKKGIIQDCRIHGDFFGTRDISDLERLIIGSQTRRDSLRLALAGIDMEQFIHNLTLESFLEMFEE